MTYSSSHFLEDILTKRYRYFMSIMAIVVLVLSACMPAATATPTRSSSTGTPPKTGASTIPPTSGAATGAATPSAETTQSGGAAGTPTAGAQKPGLQGDIDCKGAKKGDTLSMFYQRSGGEESNLNKILKPLVDACGIVLKPLSTRDQALVQTQVTAGTPPDVAFWQLSTAKELADKLKPLDSLGGHKESYDQNFIDQGTIKGKWLGLPVKLDIKSIIWYIPAYFKAHGYTVPNTWDQLNTL